MKTVVIIHHTGEWGGGTKSLIDLCEMLRGQYKVIVCIPKGFPEFAKKIGQYGCEVFELSAQIPFINIYSGSPPLLSVVTIRSIKSLRNIKRIGKEILGLNPDLVIFNTLITAVTSRYLSRFTKVICIDRETMTCALAKWIYKCLLDKHLSAITFLSEYERKKINFTRAKTIVFPDCVRIDNLTESKKEDVLEKEKIVAEKYVILFMGGLSKIKGTDVVLEAMESLDDRFTLIFAGELNEAKLSKKQLLHDIKYPAHYRFKKKVIKYYYALKGTSKLHETGLLDSVDGLIVASDIVVFPSTSVHQPRPGIEAGAYSKPVIISDYKETAEYFIDGYNALTFKPGDASELKKKILYAYENKAKMQDMGKNNRIMTEEKHNYYVCKTIICSLIERVCSNES